MEVNEIMLTRHSTAADTRAATRAVTAASSIPHRHSRAVATDRQAEATAARAVHHRLDGTELESDFCVQKARLRASMVVEYSYPTFRSISRRSFVHLTGIWKGKTDPAVLETCLDTS
jgi:hypothetical protein